MASYEDNYNEQNKIANRDLDFKKGVRARISKKNYYGLYLFLKGYFGQ